MSEGPLLGLIVVALIGLAWGLWLGMPGRDRPTADDIERAMDSVTPRRRRGRAKRSLNPFAWLRRKAEAPPSKSGRGFKLKAPDER
jgi:hypothetical protein